MPVSASLQQIHKQLKRAYKEKYKPSINDMHYDVPTLEYVSQKIRNRNYYVEEFPEEFSKDDFSDIKHYSEELINELYNEKISNEPKPP